MCISKCVVTYSTCRYFFSPQIQHNTYTFTNSYRCTNPILQVTDWKTDTLTFWLPIFGVKHIYVPVSNNVKLALRVQGGWVKCSYIWPYRNAIVCCMHSVYVRKGECWSEIDWSHSQSGRGFCPCLHVGCQPSLRSPWPYQPHWMYRYSHVHILMVNAEKQHIYFRLFKIKFLRTVSYNSNLHLK